LRQQSFVADLCWKIQYCFWDKKAKPVTQSFSHKLYSMSVPRFSPAGYDPSELDNQISARDAILQLEIPWNNLVQLGIIQERELHLIKKYDKRKIDVKTSLVQQVQNLFISKFQVHE
jgi:hypothetical protein